MKLAKVIGQLFVVSLLPAIQVASQANNTGRSDGPAATAAALPKVLIIGDSISMGYTDPVRKLLENEADVRRIPGNGQSTDFGLQHIDAWLGNERWAVIHFNWGIWDTHILPGGAIRNSTEVYRANLKALVERLKATGARLVWASTTPAAVDIVGDLGLKRENIPIYNDVAKSVVDDYHVPTDDLYRLALPRLKALQAEDGVHFSPEGSEVLARQVVESIRQELQACASASTTAVGTE